MSYHNLWLIIYHGMAMGHFRSGVKQVGLNDKPINANSILFALLAVVEIHKVLSQFQNNSKISSLRKF